MTAARPIGVVAAFSSLYFVLCTYLSAQAPVYRAGVNLVPVEIAVLDKARKPVTDLKESDFTVFENGKPQPIRTFFTQALEADPEAARAQPELVRGVAADAIAPKRRRTFLIVLGSTGGRDLGLPSTVVGRGAPPPPQPSNIEERLDGPGNAVDAALQFVRERLLPQDLVGVLALNRVTDLTTNHDQVARVIERFRREQGRIAQAMRDFYWCGICNRGEDVPPSIQKMIDEVFQPSNIAKSDRLDMRSAMRLLLASPELKSDYRYAVPGMGYGTPDDLPWNRRVVGSDLVKLYAGLEYLKAVDGDKHLVWITGTGLGRSDWSVQDDKRLAMTAGSARVAIDIYYTSPGGWATAAAERVAEMSGGQYTGVNKAANLFEQIDHATRFGYLLAYATPDPTLDKKVRNITVKVNRPDVTVLFRHGYVPEPLLTPAEQKQAVIGARLRVGASFGVEARDIGITARATFAAGPQSRVLVDAKIDASQITFLTSPDGVLTAQVEIQVFCGDAKQKVIGQTKQTMNLKIDEAAHQRMLANGIAYTVRVPVSAAPMYVKVLAYDFAADRLGAATVKLR